MVFTAERPTVETGGREHQERRGRVCADRFPPSPARLAGVLRPRHSVGGTVSRCSPRCSELRAWKKGGAEALCRKRSGPPLGVGKQQDCPRLRSKPAVALWRLLDHRWPVSLPALPLGALFISHASAPGSSLAIQQSGLCLSLLEARVCPWERT